MKVGFVGSGNMAAALARGLAGAAEPPELLFSDSGSGRAARLAAELPAAAASSTRDLAGAADLLILAVKPAALERVAAELAPAATPVVSLLGATPLTELRAALTEAPLLRAMPNVAVEVGRGVICHAPPTDPGALTAALELLGSVAELVEMPEVELDAATAVMGCSPAYLALACEELVLAGEEAGLDPALALRLVSETAAGTGELLTRRGPAELQAMVASPGGSTEAGLRALADGGAREAFRAAVRASLARMEGAG